MLTDEIVWLAGPVAIECDQQSMEKVQTDKWPSRWDLPPEQAPGHADIPHKTTKKTYPQVVEISYIDQSPVKSTHLPISDRSRP